MGLKTSCSALCADDIVPKGNNGDDAGIGVVSVGVVKDVQFSS